MSAMSSPKTKTTTASNTKSSSTITSDTSTMRSVQLVDGVAYRYLTGFHNELSSECLPGALPVGRNTPRLVPHNLYAEQLSGSAFTAPRQHTMRTWLYRIQPSVSVVGSSSTSTTTGATAPVSTRLHQYLGHCQPSECQPAVDALRWKPIMLYNNKKKVHGDFWDSLQLQCHAGDPATRHGLAIYQYAGFVSTSKTATANDAQQQQQKQQQKQHPQRHYCNADGDFLIVPCQGTLCITTELGRLTVGPTEICVLPRGMVYSVGSSPSGSDEYEDGCAGYVLEIYSCAGFQLPELGPIGSNGLANPRDFLHPVAWCVSSKAEYRQHAHTIITKKHSELFSKTTDHSPYNVVAWHGNYLPYKYDLTRFCAVNSVTYDHLDPSLYTVLTCPTDTAGTALADFVIFPPRVLATDRNTLRPPWFHRNVMSEYMGLIYGQYDAKEGGGGDGDGANGKSDGGGGGGGFRPGGASLHNAMAPHGPDAASYARAVADPCEQPVQFNGGLAFMFETCLSLSVAPNAADDAEWRDVEYTRCWQALGADDFEGWELLEQQMMTMTTMANSATE